MIVCPLILRNINQGRALTLQVWKQGMMGKPDGQTIGREFAFVIGREEEGCVGGTADGKCQLHHLKYYPLFHPTIWNKQRCHST
jgi:hypothetical protein